MSDLNSKIRCVLVKHFDGEHKDYEGCVRDIKALFILDRIKNLEKEFNCEINADFKIKKDEN